MYIFRPCTSRSQSNRSGNCAAACTRPPARRLRLYSQTRRRTPQGCAKRQRCTRHGHCSYWGTLGHCNSAPSSPPRTCMYRLCTARCRRSHPSKCGPGMHLFRCVPQPGPNLYGTRTRLSHKRRGRNNRPPLERSPHNAQSHTPHPNTVRCTYKYPCLCCKSHGHCRVRSRHKCSPKGSMLEAAYLRQSRIPLVCDSCSCRRRPNSPCLRRLSTSPHRRVAT